MMSGVALVATLSTDSCQCGNVSGHGHTRLPIDPDLSRGRPLAVYPQGGRVHAVGPFDREPADH